jgi:general secretion pathway protein E
MFTETFCHQHRVVLFEESGGEWSLCFQAPLQPWIYRDAARKVPGTLSLREISQAGMDELLHEKGESNRPEMARTLEGMVSEDSLSWMLQHLPEEGLNSLEDNEAPVIRLINTMLEEAVVRRASDIHIESFPRYFQVRYRIDGVMQEISQGDTRLSAPLISRLKIMSKLDIAEKRLPQDGRFVCKINQYSIDVRLSVIPVSHGERAVMRILDQRQLPLDFSVLGINDSICDSLIRQISLPNGIILVTGPTGSGKSSTLYACLQQLNQSSRTILTIEDPVEYKLAGIGQTQVNSRIGLDFARGLRALLRQDPDVVMIGEIRDEETARVAMQASLTGHLVFSTLHTSSAVGAVARLCDMGIEPWLLSTSLSTLLAQRLVRKLCPNCKSGHPVTDEERRWLKIEDTDNPAQVIYQPVGCDKCNYSGYSGRTGIYELVIMTSKMRELITRRASSEALEKCARETLPGIYEDAREKILSGITSFKEIMRVTAVGS